MNTNDPVAKVLFKDYLNVPSNRPTAEWFDEGDPYNNYIIGDQVFIDNVSEDPTFQETTKPEKYNGLTISKYYKDTTNVLEKFEKIKLKLVPLRPDVWYQEDENSENILKNAFQFNYGKNEKFSYILFINGTEISKGTRWLFNYKSGYITFYSNPPPSNANVEFTFVKYIGNVGINNIQTILSDVYAPKSKPIIQVEIIPDVIGYLEGDLIIVTSTNIIYRLSNSQWVPISGANDGIQNIEITNAPLRFYKQFLRKTTENIQEPLNTQGIGFDITNSQFTNIYVNKSCKIDAVKITVSNLLTNVLYDISFGVVEGIMYNIPNISLEPSNFKTVSYYTTIPTSTNLVAHFDCQSSYKNLISSNSSIVLTGGILTSSDYRVGYGSLMLPLGMVVSISPISIWNTNTWTLLFHYKFITSQNQNNDAIIMYFNNSINSSILSSNIVIMYDNTTHKIKFGKIELYQEATINIQNKWATFAITRNNNVYTLHIYTDTETVSIEFTSELTFTETEFLNFGNCEEFINETAAFIDDIRVYSSVISTIENFNIISNKNSEVQTYINLLSENIEIPEKSILHCQIHKKTNTELPEFIQLEFMINNETTETGTVIHFNKNIYTNQDFILSTGINVEGLYNNEIGNINDIIYPSSNYAYISKNITYSYLYVNFYRTFNVNKIFNTFEVKIYRKSDTDILIHSQQIVLNPLQYEYPYKRYVTAPSITSLEACFTCDKTYLNAISSSSIKLVGGILTSTEKMIGETSIYIPKGTGLVLSEHIYTSSFTSSFTIMLWYKHNNFAYPSISGLNSGENDKPYYILLGLYEKSNNHTPTLYLEYDVLNSQIRLCSITNNIISSSNYGTSVDLKEWSHISITRNLNNYTVYVNGISKISHNFSISTQLDQSHTINIATWLPGLLKASAYVSDIRIHNTNITSYTEYIVSNTSTPLSIEKIKLDTSLTINANNYIKIEIVPLNPSPSFDPQYIHIDLIPDIPYNSTFNDTTGIIKFKSIEQTLSHYNTSINTNSLTKKDYEIPYVYTYKLKSITSVMIIKIGETNMVDNSYTYVLKYGNISIIGDIHTPNIITEHVLHNTLIKSIQNLKSEEIIIREYTTSPPTDNLVFWFKCNGFRNCYMNSNYHLNGGIFTTNDVIIGNQCMVIPRGTGVSIQSVIIPSQFSISFLFKYIHTMTDDVFCVMRITSNVNENELGLFYNRTTSKFILQVGDLFVIQSTTTSLNNWTYVVVRSTGTQINVNINGTQIMTLSVQNIFVSESGNNIEFGIYEGGNISFSSYLSDVRMYNIGNVTLTRFNISNITNRTRYINYTEYKLRYPIVIPTDSIVTFNVLKTGNNIPPFDDIVYSFIYGEDVTNDILYSLLSTKFYAQSGTVEFPTYSFLDEKNTGMYKSDIHSIGFAAKGIQIANIDTSGVYVINGTNSTPSISFMDDKDTGIYRSEDNSIGFSVGGNIAMIIKSTTDVSFAGAIYAKGNITANSDIRLKKDIEPIHSVLDKIVNLQGVKYLWKDPSMNNEPIYTGFIAQDVRKYIPEVVYGNEEKEMLYMSYMGMIPFLVEAIKELKHENDKLKEEINKINNI